MPTETEPLLVVVDANVFLAVLLPETTKASPDNVRGAERLLRALDPGKLVAVTPAMTLAEVRWAFARSGQGDHLRAFHILVTALAGRVQIMPITAALAYECGAIKATHYSRDNDMSYVDALCIAAALESGATAIVSTDPHLLKVASLRVEAPGQLPESGDMQEWFRRPRQAS